MAVTTLIIQPMASAIELGIANPLHTLTFVQHGIQGIKGDVGNDGADGVDGADGAAFSGYFHTQGTPSNVWVIPHNLGYHPSVEIIDSAGTEWEGDVFHDSNVQTTVTLSVAFSGKARLI